jgi:aspartate aminotransferase
MNNRLEMVLESETVRFADVVRSLEQNDRTITKLQTGDPDFETHPEISEAGFKAIRDGLTHYSTTKGLRELREAIANKLKQENGLEVCAEREILITHGGAHGIFIAIQSILNPGDEVLIPEPYWMPYRAGTLLAGGIPRSLPTDSSDYKLMPDQLREAIGPRTKAIIFNSPSNPSGNVYTREELTELCEIAVRNGLYIISDEVYEHILYDGNLHFSPASDSRFRLKTITVFSFSKSYAMTGWRIGYVLAPPAICTQMLKILQYSITHVAPFIQKAALAALTSSAVKNYLDEMRNEYSYRRDLIANYSKLHLNDLIKVPDGAFYCLVNVKKAYPDSLTAAMSILERYNVAFTPGVAFGNSTKDFLRMTFAANRDDIKKGLEVVRQEFV